MQPSLRPYNRYLHMGTEELSEADRPALEDIYASVIDRWPAKAGWIAAELAELDERAGYDQQAADRFGEAHQLLRHADASTYIRDCARKRNLALVALRQDVIQSRIANIQPSVAHTQALLADLAEVLFDPTVVNAGRDRKNRKARIAGVGAELLVASLVLGLSNQEEYFLPFPSSPRLEQSIVLAPTSEGQYKDKPLKLSNDLVAIRYNHTLREFYRRPIQIKHGSGRRVTYHAAVGTISDEHLAAVLTKKAEVCRALAEPPDERDPELQRRIDLVQAAILREISCCRVPTWWHKRRRDLNVARFSRTD
jgi:hypothetical protein